MKKRGFTYIEVMIAFAIFAILMVFVMKLDSTANRLMRYQQEQLRMVYTAQMAMEKYKYNQITYEDNNFNGYYVKVEETPINKTFNNDIAVLTEIKITVKKNKNDLDTNGVILYNDFNN
jgi:prepilin-type N-terminal cleavage/methylation domain-containing protein